MLEESLDNDRILWNHPTGCSPSLFEVKGLFVKSMFNDWKTGQKFVAFTKKTVFSKHDQSWNRKTKILDILQARQIQNNNHQPVYG